MREGQCRERRESGQEVADHVNGERHTAEGEGLKRHASIRRQGLREGEERLHSTSIHPSTFGEVSTSSMDSTRRVVLVVSTAASVATMSSCPWMDLTRTSSNHLLVRGRRRPYASHCSVSRIAAHCFMSTLLRALSSTNFVLPCSIRSASSSSMSARRCVICMSHMAA